MPIQTRQELSKLCQETLSKAFSSTEEWKDLLAFMACHYKQSYANQIALYAQCPKATAFAAYSYWNKLHMPIQRGEHAYCIFSDNARGISRGIFDVAQTSGDHAQYERLRWDYDPARDAAALDKAFPGLTTEPVTLLIQIYEITAQQSGLSEFMQNAVARSVFYCLCSRLHIEFNHQQLIPGWGHYTIKEKQTIAQQTSKITHSMLSQIERSARHEQKQNQQVEKHGANPGGLVQPSTERAAGMVRQPAAGTHQPDDANTLLQDTARRRSVDATRPGLADSKTDHAGISGEGTSDPPGQSRTLHAGLSAVLAAVPPLQQLVTAITPYIEQGQALTQMELFRLADAAYGGTQAEGTYTAKDATDRLEYAVNLYLSGLAQDWNASAENAVQSMTKLEQLVRNLPTQTRRTPESEALQQFSTPPQLACLAAWAANIQREETVLEPSAGIGGLAVFAKAWGAKVVVNELSDRRAAFLKTMGFEKVYQENAEQIDNILPDTISPGVILMNPPFSVAAGRMQNHKTEYGLQHVEQALARLADHGRLVAILGQGMADNAPAHAQWWEEIKARYQVRANIPIDGANYQKYGTTFGVQLIIIDKTGATTEPVLTEPCQDLTMLPKRLERIRNERYPTMQQHTAFPGDSNRAESPNVPEQLSLGGGIGHDSRAASRTGDTGIRPVRRTVADHQREHASLGMQSEMVSDGDTGAGSGNGDGLRRGSHVGTDNRSEQIRGREDDRTQRDDRVQSGSEWMRLGAKPTRVDSAMDVGEDGVYTIYAPAQISVEGAQPHPAELVESAAMAAVLPPEATYLPRIPQALVTSGALSEAQLENILYAGQAHQQLLPDGERRGYFIGDGTGVGKGRQICGIIQDNFNQGRTRAIWVSKNHSLIEDAQRDWVDLGGQPSAILDLSTIRYKDITVESGVLFTTYDTLKSSSKAGENHLDQIEKWCGKDFDGVLIFDEAHHMANALDAQSRHASKRAIAGVKLQECFPNARVVYASATGATDVKDYAYLTRLGLWGSGTAFPDVKTFISQISSGGLAAMELVARDMKSMGMYMTRSISFRGVQYDTLQHSLTPMQREMYDTMSHAWQTILTHTEEALKATHAALNAQARRNARGQLFGSMQRFYNQLLTSMSMPSVVQDIRRELDAGHSCVLQLVNTNQAAADRSIAQAQETGLDNVDMTPRETIVQYLYHCYPTQQYEEYMDKNGNILSRAVTDRNGKAVQNREMVRQRDALIEHIKEMKIPDGALEILLNNFGTEEVAEVTGRTRRLVEKRDADGQTHRVVEARSPRHATADAQAFQDGKKHILVFSEAGGTGKSYHADRRAVNQQKCIHYLLQPGWNASSATQGFGRTHRSNQVSAPIFRLITTDISGQKRFISTIARRLDQLGALTKGQRQTGSGIFGQKDNLESPLAKDTLSQFYRALIAGEISEVSDGIGLLQKIGLKEKFMNKDGAYREDPAASYDMNLFLNRILALEVDEQNTLFQAYYARFEQAMENAIADGSLDIGLETYQADKVDIQARQTLANTGTTYVHLLASRHTKLLPYTQLENFGSDFQGIFRYVNGTVRAVYRIADSTLSDGSVTSRYLVQSPVLRQKSIYLQKTLDKQMRAVPPADWKKSWEQETAKAPEFEEESLHLLTGTLLPVWDKLPQDNTRVMRIKTSTGEQFLGRFINEDRIEYVLRRLGISSAQHTARAYTAKEIMDAILKENKGAVLAQDHLCLFRSRVSGEYRMELKGDNLWWLAKQHDILCETIAYHKRYFLPVSHNGEKILDTILCTNPVQALSDFTNFSMSASEDTMEESLKLG